MGYITEKINAKLPKAFDGKLGDAVKPFTGSRSVAGEYDPATGTSTDTTVTYSGRGVFGSFRQEEVDGQIIISTDTKLSGVLQSELLLNDDQGQPTSARATPKVEDRIGDQKVVAVMQDPASATWSMALRKT